MIKIIIFDYGGVIGNDPTNYILRAVSRKFGINVDRIKAEFLKFNILLEKNQILQENFWKKFSENLGITDYKKLRKAWINEFKKHAKINKKMLFLIKKLKNHYKLCLLSNRVIFYRKSSITKSLRRTFPIIVYSFNVKMRKPEKKIYLYIVKKLRSKAQECLIVDDQEEKLFYPRKLGMKVIHFETFLKFKEELSEKLNNKNDLFNLVKKSSKR